MVGGAVREGEGIVVGQRVLSAGVRSAERESADVLGVIGDVTVERDRCDSGVALVVVLEEHTTTIATPPGILDAAVEVPADEPRVASVPVHYIEARELIPLVPVVKAQVRDASTVRRNPRGPIRPVAIGERHDIARRQRQRVHFGVVWVRQPIVVPVRREDQARAIRGPRGGAVVIRPARHLPRGAALGGEHKELAVPVLEIAPAVGSIGEVVNDRDVRSPIRTIRLVRHVGPQTVRLFRYKHRERDPIAVGRPREPTRAPGEVGELGFLTGIHPPRVDLKLAVFVGHVGEPRPVGEPAGLHVRVGPGFERAVL